MKISYKNVVKDCILSASLFVVGGSLSYGSEPFKVESETLTSTQRQKMQEATALYELLRDEKPKVVTSEPLASQSRLKVDDVSAKAMNDAKASLSLSGSIAEDVRLGVISDVKAAKGVTQSFKKDATATGTVEQGNISGSAFGGGVTQKFIGTVDAKKVEQGNISGTTIEGDIDQEF